MGVSPAGLTPVYSQISHLSTIFSFFGSFRLTIPVTTLKLQGCKENFPPMFEAMLLVCALATPDRCVRFDDTRGPYQTYEQCKARSYEMARGVVELFPVPATYSFKCIEREFT